MELVEGFVSMLLVGLGLGLLRARRDRLWSERMTETPPCFIRVFNDPINKCWWCLRHPL